METKFTPGPWSFSRSEQWGDTRFYVAQEEGAPYTPNYSDVATLIAETVSGEIVHIQEANARLIAAAPELFEALQAMVEYCAPVLSKLPNLSEEVKAMPEYAAVIKARAALAKATGEQL